MPVSIATPLPPIAFSRNKIPLEISSDDYLSAAPAFSVNTLEFTTAVAIDQQININWTGAAAQLTAKASPDDSGNQIPNGDGLGTYVTTLVDYFQSNYFIDKFYVVAVDTSGANPKLVFTARSAGPDYDFTPFSVGGIVSAVDTAGVTNQPKINFAHHVEVWVQNEAGSAYDLAYDSNVPLDFPRTGLTTLDLGDEVLHSFLTSDEPELVALAALCLNSIRPYYIKYAQYYGEPAGVQKIYKTAPAIVAKGGLGMRKQLTTDIDTMLNPVSGHPEQSLFARLGSINKLIGTAQPEWLTYVNTAASAITADVEVIIYNDDATTFTFSPVTAFNIPAYGKAQFQAGYTQLNISGQQAGSIVPVYYTVRLKDGGGNYLTAAYAFVIDYVFYRWPRYFVYENSLGAYQTIATVGKGQAEFNRSKDTGQKAIGRSEAAIAGEFIETNIFIQDKFSVAIGYNRAGERNTALLRDLFLSRKIYLWDASELLPIGINTDNLKDAMDGQNPYANSFEYFPLYPEHVYSEQAGVEDDTVTDLLNVAGVATPPPAPIAADGIIVVEYGDTHLSIVGGQQVYTAPFWLGGKVDYRIDSTQIANYFRSTEVTYNSGAGSFTITYPGFILQPGEQINIHPFVLNPDAP